MDKSKNRALMWAAILLYALVVCLSVFDSYAQAVPTDKPQMQFWLVITVHDRPTRIDYILPGYTPAALDTPQQCQMAWKLMQGLAAEGKLTLDLTSDSPNDRKGRGVHAYCIQAAGPMHLKQQLLKNIPNLGGRNI